MLKRFIVKNFLSYQEENILELTASDIDSNLNHFFEVDTIKILKTAVIYGANASGKSNLIKAIKYAQDIVLKSLNRVERNKKYFRLNKKGGNTPTTFEFELEIKGQIFSYGFSSLLTSKTITEEWLYIISSPTPEKIFERENNDISLGEWLKNIEEVKNRLLIYSDDMKNQPHQLFLSEIGEKNLKIEGLSIIENIYNWFEKKLLVIYPTTKFGRIGSINEDKNLAQIFKTYLRKFDTGIIDIKSVEEDVEKIFKQFKLPDTLKEKIENDLNDTSEISIHVSDGLLYTIYKDNNNELKARELGLVHNHKIDDTFSLEDESDGTIRLFDLIPLISGFSEDRTIIIDEFERSLHPNLTKKFFELFYEVENSKAQLIVTTHESTLLNLKERRRDEIWFVEKDKQGGSQLFSFNQFEKRFDNEIKDAYLAGRYGAIPVFKKLIEESDNGV